MQGESFSLDLETDIAVGVVVGKRLSGAIRAEAEATYAQVELGIGAGWTLSDEACAEEGGVEFCADADIDDWTVQRIVGASLSASENCALVALGTG